MSVPWKIKLPFTISWLIVEILSLHRHHWHSLCSVAYHWTFPRVTISSSDLTKVKHSIDNVTQKNFQLNVKCDSVLLWFCFTPLCYCSRTSQDSLKQSDSKLVATRLPAFSRVFPHLRRFSWFYVEFSLAPWDIFLFSDWLFLFLVLQHLIKILAEIRKEKKTERGEGGENDNQE